jgi:predicted outer membrane repeat protein
VYGGEDLSEVGFYDVILAPIPIRCDIVIEPNDTEGLFIALAEASNAPISEVICLTESTYRFNPESVAQLIDADGLNALPSINRSVTINGHGAVIERDPGSEFAFRFFHIESPGALVLNDLTLSGGLAGVEEEGGAILSKGTLTLINTTFLNNEANSGGAISHSGVIATIVESDFTNNTAAGDDGGAIENAGSVIEIIDSTFFDNTASDNGGSVDNDGGVISIENTIFAFSSSGDDGGAVFSSGELLITDTLFRLNVSRDDGGGVYNDDLGTAILINVSFTRNNASDEGGAISNDGVLSASNSCFNGNTASDYSGVAGIATGTSVTNNWWGGGSGPTPADEDDNGGTINNELAFEPFLSSMPTFCEAQ